MHEESQGTAGESRRDFLKKAGAVAWVVPTLQVVNMASAAAGDTAGSMVTTTPPPSTSKPPECVEYVYYRLKADWTGNSYQWEDGIGRNDCIKDGKPLDGDDLGAAISISGDEREAVVKHSLPDCEIKMAKYKAGQDCKDGMVAADGSYAKFSAGPEGRDNKDISHVELLVKCCVKFE